MSYRISGEVCATLSDLSPAQVAETTGFSRDTIYREIKTGRLAAYKRRGQLRVTPHALGEWREQGKVQPELAESPMPEPTVLSRPRPLGGSFASRLKAIEGGRG